MSAEQTIDGATLSEATIVLATEGVIAEVEEKPAEAMTTPAEMTAIVEPKPTKEKPAKVKKAKEERPVRPGFRAVLVMGYGVLVPLVAMAMVVVMTSPGNGVANVLKVEITYAAALLSFLAGIRWGVALMAGGDHLRFRPLAGITLMLPLGWITIFLKPPVALGLLMVGFLVLAMSEREDKTGPAPDWYHALLKPFTILVEVALGVTLLIILNF